MCTITCIHGCHSDESTSPFVLLLQIIATVSVGRTVMLKQFTNRRNHTLPHYLSMPCPSGSCMASVSPKALSIKNVCRVDLHNDLHVLSRDM